MRKSKVFAMASLFAFSLAICEAQDVVSAVKGTVRKVDASAKTIVVKTGDGADHTFHYLGRTAVHSATATDHATIYSVDKIEEGAEVVAHYTTTGGKDTVTEIDRVGKDGLKASTGTIDELDRGGKTLVLKTADGTRTTFHLSAHAAADGGRDIAKGSEKSAHVTVYYTEAAGRKVAHFFTPSS